MKTWLFPDSRRPGAAAIFGSRPILTISAYDAPSLRFSLLESFAFTRRSSRLVLRFYGRAFQSNASLIGALRCYVNVRLSTLD